MAKRIVFILGFLSFCLVMVALRGIYLQIVPNERLEHRKGRQFSKTITLDSRRGDILDRNGKELAVSMASFSLYADPALIPNPKDTSKKVAKILDIAYEPLFKKMKNKKSRFFWVKRRVSEKEHQLIGELKVKGLAFKQESKRVYPNGPMLASVIGFVGREGQGLSGLESRFDKHLSGNKKKVIIQKDARGRPLIENGWVFLKNQDGNDIFLTLDRETQYTLEQELKSTVVENEAESGVAVILDVKTSAVVAMANYPSFDPNTPADSSFAVQRNRAVTDAFEPGSTMKTFLVAGTIRDKFLQPNSKIDTANGELRIGKRVISESDKSHKFGVISLAEVLAKSSNVGTSKVAIKYGATRLHQVLSDFGFGAPTGIASELPGEAKGILLPEPWSIHTLTSASFGHSISATPLQIANGYAAIANGGILNKPYIISALRDNETGLIEQKHAVEIRRVMEANDAAKITMMLTLATGIDGTGGNARIAGFSVAGKTGTAQKVDPNGRGYLNGAYISSFAGYFPSNSPRFVIYVAVDQPKKAYYGSQVAAPVFSKMAQFLARREGLSPVILTKESLKRAPAIVEALKMNNHLLNKLLVKPLQKLVVTEEKSIMGLSASTIPETSLGISEVEAPKMPRLQGLSLREVMRTFHGQKVDVQIKGSGRVSRTYPEEGETLKDDQQIKVIFSSDSL